MRLLIVTALLVAKTTTGQTPPKRSDSLVLSFLNDYHFGSHEYETKVIVGVLK
jgi:hypothetical protein